MTDQAESEPLVAAGQPELVAVDAEHAACGSSQPGTVTCCLAWSAAAVKGSDFLGQVVAAAARVLLGLPGLADFAFGLG